MVNLLLIDDIVVEKDVFMQNVNADTRPILFSEYTNTNYENITRIAIAFHGSPIVPRFIRDNLEGIIDKSGTRLTRIDFLGCRTLNFQEWNDYYSEVETKYSGITIGASNDDTGNLQYGGNFVMENTGEDIKSVYFNNLDNYRGVLYSSSGKQNQRAFAMLKKDNSIVCWGDEDYGGVFPTNSSNSDFKEIFSTNCAFAGLRHDGTVCCWGNENYGGVLTVTFSKTKFKDIYSTSLAFAGLTETGLLVCWGHEDTVRKKPIDESGFTQIVSNDGAFAGLKGDTIVCWGTPDYGGIFPSTVANSGFTEIWSSVCAFFGKKNDDAIVCWGPPTIPSGNTFKEIVKAGAAYAGLTKDGLIICWGNTTSGKVFPPEHATSVFTSIYSTDSAFAAIKVDKTVVCWGHYLYGGDYIYGARQNISPNSDFVKIYSTNASFLGLKSNKTIALWGNPSSASYDYGRCEGGNVKEVISNKGAFAALKYDGSLVYWQNYDFNGEFSNSPKFTNIFSIEGAFAGLKEDGTVVCWGPNLRKDFESIRWVTGGNKMSAEIRAASYAISEAKDALADAVAAALAEAKVSQEKALADASKSLTAAEEALRMARALAETAKEEAETSKEEAETAKEEAEKSRLALSQGFIQSATDDDTFTLTLNNTPFYSNKDCFTKNGNIYTMTKSYTISNEQQIPVNVTVKVPNGMILTNNSVFVNNGTVDNRGTLINYGNLVNKAYINGSGKLETSSLVINTNIIYCGVHVKYGASMKSSVALFGDVTIHKGGHLNLASFGSNITVNGKLSIVNSTVSNSNYITISKGGILTIQHGKFTNKGTIKVTDNGRIHLHNNTFDNQKTVTFENSCFKLTESSKYKHTGGGTTNFTNSTMQLTNGSTYSS